MGSFLRRMTSISKLDEKRKKIYSTVTFDIDEPDFLLKRKFGSLPKINKYNWSAVNSRYLNITNCPKCSNNEFSSHAKYCKICGYEIDSN